MPIGLTITLVICLALITLTKLNNDHKVKMAELQLKRDANPFIPKKDGGNKHE